VREGGGISDGIRMQVSLGERGVRSLKARCWVSSCGPGCPNYRDETQSGEGGGGGWIGFRAGGVGGGGGVVGGLFWYNMELAGGGEGFYVRGVCEGTC